MSAPVNDGLPEDPAVLSAIVAAVQAYIDEEERMGARTPANATGALSAWKTMVWRPFRGGAHTGQRSWRHAA